MKETKPTAEELDLHNLRTFKGIEVGLGEADPVAAIAQKLEAQHPGHLILVQSGSFLHGFDRTAYALSILKSYKLKLVGVATDPHLRVGFPAGDNSLTNPAFCGYSSRQVLRNTSISGMSPRKPVTFFTSIGFAPLGGMCRQYKTRKGNTDSRLIAVSNILPAPRRNGFKVSIRSNAMSKQIPKSQNPLIVPSHDSLREMYCKKQYSKQDVADLYGVTIYRVETWMKSAGIQTRTKKEAVHAALGKISNALKGKRKNFTPEWKANISASRIKWCEKNASGISFKTGGYAEYTMGEHKGRSVHVVAMEQHIGRPLAKGEIVHHKDGNKQNNDLSNLELLTRSEHQRHHRKEQKQNRTGRTKLGAEDVLAIRERYAEGGTSHAKLAAEYGLNRSYVGHLVRGKTWKEVV